MTGLRLAVSACLAGAAAVLVGCSLGWGTVTEQAPPLPVRDWAIHGSTIAPGLRALGVLGALGVIGIAATRGLGRVLVGLGLVGTGVGGAVAAALWLRPGHLRGGLLEAFLRCPDDCGPRSAAAASVQGVHAHLVGPLVALLGALLLTAAGALTAARGRRWARLGSSYEAPGTEPAEPVTDKGVWDALDRGDDPTA